LVEHIWPAVNKQLDITSFNSKDDLWAALDVAFGKVDPEYIKRLYASMIRRLTAVVVANGANTKY
jgi:FKBP-type peptidyl-prolyl cis-trans isomerase 2